MNPVKKIRNNTPYYQREQKRSALVPPRTSPSPCGERRRIKGLLPDLPHNMSGLPPAVPCFFRDALRSCCGA